MGFPCFEAVRGYGLLAPAKTWPAYVGLLNAQTNAALNSREVKAKFEADWATIPGGSSDKFMSTLCLRGSRGLMKSSHD